MKRLVCAAIAAALLVPGSWAVGARAKDGAPGMRGGPREMGAKMEERAKAKLGLTDEQEAKFKDAMKAHMDAEKPLKRKMRDQMTKLGDQLQDKADDSAIKATLDALKDTRQAMTAEQEKFHDSLAAFLTPTQQAKLVVGMAMRMHQGMMGPGRKKPRMGGPRAGVRPDPAGDEDRPGQTEDEKDGDKDD